MSITKQPNNILVSTSKNLKQLTTVKNLKEQQITPQKESNQFSDIEMKNVEVGSSDKVISLRLPVAVFSENEGGLLEVYARVKQRDKFDTDKLKLDAKI